MPTAWFDSMNGLLCIILAPTLAALWNKLSKKGKDPSMMTKTALGIMLLGLGVAMMVVGAGIYNGTGKPVGVWIIIMTAILMSVGEMLFSPLGNCMAVHHLLRRTCIRPSLQRNERKLLQIIPDRCYHRIRSRRTDAVLQEQVRGYDRRYRRAEERAR